jgi:hypothetical protein
MARVPPARHNENWMGFSLRTKETVFRPALACYCGENGQVYPSWDGNFYLRITKAAGLSHRCHPELPLLAFL